LSEKTRGGGICFYINGGWCPDVSVEGIMQPSPRNTLQGSYGHGKPGKDILKWLFSRPGKVLEENVITSFGKVMEMCCICSFTLGFE